MSAYYAQSPPPAPSTGKVPGRGLIRSGIVCMVLAVLLGGVALFLAFRPLFDVAPQQINGPTTIEITESGSYAIYALGGVSGFGPTGCQVTGPEGPVTLDPPFGDQTVTTNGTTYTLQEVFTASPGTHVVTCQEGTVRYAVGEEVNVFRTLGLGIGGVFGGGALFVLGLVLLIIGVVRKGRGRDQSPPHGYGGPHGGQPYVGQPYGGQPYPGQPYPGQGQQPPPGQQPGW